MIDSTAPILKTLTFPSIINVSSGNQSVTFSVHAEDTGSGIANVVVWFDKPFATNGVGLNLLGLFSGWNDSTPFDASTMMTVLSTNNPGTYHITSVDVHDVAGNMASYSPSQLAALGISTSLSVTGSVADTTAPTLKSLTFPGTIDVSSGDQVINFSAHAEDAGSGIANVVVWFDKPFATNGVGLNLLGLFSGWNDSTPFDASTMMTVLSTNNPGTYHITSVDVHDVAGNMASYSPSQLAALGISSSLSVTGSMADTTAPTLKSLTFPGTIDVSSGDQVINFSAHAEDAGSGIANVVVWFDKPFATNGVGLNLLGLFSGWNDSTPFDASTMMSVLSTNNPGIYHITSVDVHDVAGNMASYSPSQLAALGISTSLTITDHATDTTAPTATFTPGDEANNVGITSNIILTFSEAVTRGTGHITLRTVAGSAVATYDAATSSNLSISGNTLTLDPSADLLPGTAYKVEFTSGSVKDLAGNSYAGTTSYNFTTASAGIPTSSNFDDLIVLQRSSPAYVGGDVGNDTYLLSGTMLALEAPVTISDSKGHNSLQLMNGLHIASSKVSSTSLQLTLAYGGVINVFGANTFSYEPGGNMTTGVDLADISYASFAQSVLGVTVPASGIASGGRIVVGNQYPSIPHQVISPLDDFVVLQKSSPAYIGAGIGNDTYLLSASMLTAGLNLTISDSQGSNSLQLTNGLAIASSKVASNALQLTLTNGSVINVFGANAFTYDIGSNSTAAMDDNDISYASFVERALGLTVPTSGVVSGGAAVIGTVIVPPLALIPGTSAYVTATNEADIFTFTPAAAKTLVANTQIHLNAFNIVNDKLQLDLATALGTTTLAALDGVEGIRIEVNDITEETLINFGTDANGDVVALTLVGVITPASVVVDVV